jgi:hypothetical protein
MLCLFRESRQQAEEIDCVNDFYSADCKGGRNWWTAFAAFADKKSFLNHMKAGEKG